MQEQTTLGTFIAALGGVFSGGLLGRAGYEVAFYKDDRAAVLNQIKDLEEAKAYFKRYQKEVYSAQAVARRIRSRGLGERIRAWVQSRWRVGFC